MKKCALLRWLKLTLVLSLGCSFAFMAAAQNYYPADIGNMWVLESTDGTKRSTYTLERPETVDGEELVLLKIQTEEFSTDEIDTDKYFVSVDDEGLKLHSITLEDPVAILTAKFPTPATFFPIQFELGDEWQIVADEDAEATLETPRGLAISGKSTTDFKVVGFEDVVTPAGAFQNCAKVQIDLQLNTGFLTLKSTTYQWLAADVGPVKYENSEGLTFELINSNTLPYDVTGDGVINILDLTFVASRFGEADSDADVTGDGIVNILDLVRIAQHLGN